METQTITQKSNNKALLKSIVSQIPEFTFGEERQDFISKLLKETSMDMRVKLKRYLDRFLVEMVEKEASDIDLGGYGCAGKIWYRVHGDKNEEERFGTFQQDDTDILILNILSEKDRDQLFTNRFVDFSYSIGQHQDKIRFRATAYFELNHLGLNMRLINKKVRPIKSLGFHENIIKLLSLKYLKHGLVLLTGITGSGKSTTLDSIIDINNRTINSHIVIISNPVEFVHNPIKSIVRHREIGRDVHGFKEGSIQALRQDPDIIVISEMRDPDTIATVLEVADSGHKVFTTLHTSSATEAIDRILGETPASEQVRIRERLADVITCVISQKLVPSLDGKRILAKEVLVATPAVKTAIRNNHTDEIYQLIHSGGRLGMITMEQDLVQLYKRKKISFYEAFNHANNKKRFEDLIKLRT
jgi:twitching motility protein PilT